MSIWMEYLCKLSLLFHTFAIVCSIDYRQPIISDEFFYSYSFFSRCSPMLLTVRD